MREVKQAFATMGKNLTGRSSSLKELTPMLMGGVPGTNVGTTIYFNHTGRDVDADFGHGRIKPNDMVIITLLGNASRYTQYSTVSAEALAMYLELNSPIFRLRNDACPTKSRVALSKVVDELNNFFTKL